MESAKELPKLEELLYEIDQTQDVAWNLNIDNRIIRSWLDNFNGDALGDKELEHQLACWLLYNFTFFNEGEIKHLCKLMLKKYLHYRFNDQDIITMEMIRNEISNTQFKGLGLESESGAYITYLFRQENDLPLSLFINDIITDKQIVFIDDITISGNQALRRIETIKYSGYELFESDISNELVKRVNSNSDELIARLCEKDHYSFKDKQELVSSLNSSVIKNTEFLKKSRDSFKNYQFDKQTQKLIDEYDNLRLSNKAIWKMNRLILEGVYSDYIYKSKRNFDIEKMYLLTFIASKEAIIKLKDKGVKVIACIEIDESSEAFSDSSIVFLNVPQYRDSCKKMCEYYGKRISDYPMGYENGQLLIGFYYSIPNNTLPIFWSNRDNWKPLFTRHEKRFSKEIDDVFGRYL